MSGAKAEVVQKQSAAPSAGILQRKCDKCKKKEKEKGVLLRAAITDSPLKDVPQIVHEVLRSLGQPLDKVTRDFMEPRFGYDFSRVQVHAGAKAAESAKSVNALAYTVGKDVVFGQGRYQPETNSGLRLLAHELTHVVQQGGSTAPMQGNMKASDKESTAECEAREASEMVLKGLPAKVRCRYARLTLNREEGQNAGPRRFSAEGVSVIIRQSCSKEGYGLDTVEDETNSALNSIFNSDCIEESRRLRIQRNLTRHGLDIRRARSNTINACAESTGYSIPANIMTVGSKSFAGHPDSDPACQPLGSTILHEIVHITRGTYPEALPASCEASCFGAGDADPDLCRNIDVYGKRAGE
jgi:hypothetical protein